MNFLDPGFPNDSGHTVIPDGVGVPEVTAARANQDMQQDRGNSTNQGNQAARDPLSAFLVAASVPRDQDHSSGTIDLAERIRTANPEVAGATIHSAAVLGDDGAVRRFVESAPGSATAKGGPHTWDALTYLCFSRYLRLDETRSDGFVRAARALLDAGADPNTGWFEESHQPNPSWEGALYGAAGVAHHEELTRLLLERGADPNDGETVYHTPEGYHNRALRALFESGKLTQDSLVLMLVRKADWHDTEGIKYLLEHGADPNRMTRWDFPAFHHALRRDNSLEIIQLMLDHGADPTVANQVDGRTAIVLAARGGRSDVLEEFQKRGIPIELSGVDRLIAACALRDETSARALAEKEPGLVDQLKAEGTALLATFAGTGNPSGVRLLLDLGVPVGATYSPEDGYWGIAPNSTALHAAAWRASHDSVKLLLERGAPVNGKDAKGRTPLMLAVRACVDSYWTEMRSPESVAALLAAGASTEGVLHHSGYEEVDELIRRHRAEGKA